MKRISYHWLKDMTYTMAWSVILMPIFLTLLHLTIYQSPPDFDFLLIAELILVPMSTVFIGLKPLIGLYSSVDTLYIDQFNNLAFKTGEIIDIENIETVNVHQVGSVGSRMKYYEILTIELPRMIMFRKRKSMVIVEPYDIRNIFQSRTDFLTHLIERGLPKEKIHWKKLKIKHLFGFREKFKE